MIWPVGWQALEQWGNDVVRIEPLTGGVGVNEVWSVRVNGHLAVGRLGQRSDADLAWETDLLRHLDREGMTVPVPIPTTDGRHFADGLVVMTYVEGGSPETEAAYAAAVRSLTVIIAALNGEIATMERQVTACFRGHPDAAIYLSQPGTGEILGARQLGEFGDDPHRYASAKARKDYAATSPVPRQSGKKKIVLARFIRNARLADAVHRQAQSALRASP